MYPPKCQNDNEKFGGGFGPTGQRIQSGFGLTRQVQSDLIGFSVDFGLHRQAATVFAHNGKIGSTIGRRVRVRVWSARAHNLSEVKSIGGHGTSGMG